MLEELKYFKLAKELNDEHHDLLIEKKLHFRGNKNSVSLISLAKETAEKGVPNIKEKEKAESILHNQIILEEPKRDTPEKVLQAWIILDAMRNNGKLPFKENLTFITSELVFANKEEYQLSKPNRDIRNDVLAIDNDNNLCIIELKYSRVNEVKKQTIEFEKVVKNETEFFHQLVLLYTNQKWNGSIRKIAVWPNTKGKARTQEYADVEEVNYSQNGNDFSF
ncbi:hypothetical protein [Parvicella tangerina]|uniref:Uncharacterized protein n=1 Tax=Parvicella tangerina TaxID=2829795 RepID=A0A916JSW9_9FLAO|nr:hypothetical protein [Parvicella tangerina]CAG5087730.1 hypothetical protein CRYO30217_03563 [Parvicella tangerina]